LLNLNLHERVAIASIVGASRPRVTEHLGQMERDHLLKQNRGEASPPSVQLMKFLQRS
jgi:hypothetical protein